MVAISLEMFERFKEAARAQLGLEMDGAALEKIMRLHQVLLDACQRINLTRITAPADYLLKHVLDSLALVKVFPQIMGEKSLRMLDIGTGGGFPGLPLAIVFPEHDWLLVDSTAKKIREVKRFIADLGLKNCRAAAARAVELSGRIHGLRESFDACTARAAGKLEKLASESRQLPLPGGKLFVYLSAEQEVIPGFEPDNSSTIGQNLKNLKKNVFSGWEVKEFDSFTLEFDGEKLERKFVMLVKIK